MTSGTFAEWLQPLPLVAILRGVKPEEILDIIENEKPERACKTLVDMANERGGHDNITVITLKVKAVKHQSSGIMGMVSWLMSPLKKLLN